MLQSISIYPERQTRESVVATLLEPFAEGPGRYADIEARGFLCNMYSDSFPQECLQALLMILEESRRLNIVEAQLGAHVVLTALYAEAKETEKAGAHLQATLDLMERPTLSFRYKAMGVHMLGYMHWSRGEYAIAFDKVFELLKEIDKVDSEGGRGWIYYSLGVFNYDIKDHENSVKYYSIAHEHFERSEEKIQNHYGTARSKTGIASCYIQLERYNEAEKLLKESLEVYRHLMVTAGISRVLNDLATIEKIRKNYVDALAFQLEAFQIRHETGHLQGKLTSLNELGEIYLELANYQEAEKYLQEAKTLGEHISAKAKTFRAYFLLSQLYKRTGQAAKALEHYEKFHELKEEVLGQNSTNEIKRLQNQFDREKSEKEAEIERLKNIELKSAHEAISLKNKEILDSIHYAKRIQQSLLPTDKFIERILKEAKNR